MKNLSLLSMFALIFAGIAPQVQADTYVANFNSTSLDSNLTLNNSYNWSVISGGGVLDFSTNGDATTKTSSGVTYSQFLTGDFTAAVNIDISNTNNVIASLSFYGVSGSGLKTNISAYRTTNPLDTTYHIGGYDPITQSFPTNLHGLGPITSLQVVRTGNIFTESFMTSGASDFTVWHTFDGSAWDGFGGKISLYASLNAPKLANADVKFSNFTVTTPVPEPEIYTMFLSGLGLMGVFARRKKQLQATT